MRDPCFISNVHEFSTQVKTMNLIEDENDDEDDLKAEREMQKSRTGGLERWNEAPNPNLQGGKLDFCADSLGQVEMTSDRFGF